MTKSQLQTCIHDNESLLFSLEDVFDTSDKVVLSKWSAASFWGFSPKIDSEWNITVPKGYHNASLDKAFKVNQKVESKFETEIIKFKNSGVEYKVYSPERTLVEMIKDAKSFFNDVLIEAIKTFFTEIKYSHDALIRIAKEYKVEGEVRMAMSLTK